MGSTLGVLRHSQFRLIWLGIVSISVGAGVAQFALGWLLVLVAVKEGRPELASFYIGLVGASRGLPGLVFGLLGGVFADRFDRRRLLIGTRTVSTAVGLALALLVLTDSVSLIAVIVLNAIAAMADAMDQPVRSSTVAYLLPPKDLTAAQGLLMSTWSSISILGPLAAAALLGPIGIGGLLMVNAVASLLAVVALLWLDPVPTSGAEHAGVVRSLGVGLVYVARDPVLRWVIVLSITASLFVRPFNPLLPAFAQNQLHVGATELGWLLSAAGLGSLLGAVVPMVLGSIGRHGLAMLVSIVAWGVVTLLAGLQTDLVPALILVALPHAAWTVFASFGQVLCQALPPDQLRGRVIGLYSVSFWAFMPLGGIVVGSLGALIGVGNAIAAGGAVTLAVALVALVTSGATRRATLRGGAALRVVPE